MKMIKSISKKILSFLNIDKKHREELKKQLIQEKKLFLFGLKKGLKGVIILIVLLTIFKVFWFANKFLSGDVGTFLDSNIIENQLRGKYLLKTLIHLTFSNYLVGLTGILAVFSLIPLMFTCRFIVIVFLGAQFPTNPKFKKASKKAMKKILPKLTVFTIIVFTITGTYFLLQRLFYPETKGMNLIESFKTIHVLEIIIIIYIIGIGMLFIIAYKNLNKKSFIITYVSKSSIHNNLISTIALIIFIIVIKDYFLMFSAVKCNQLILGGFENITLDGIHDSLKKLTVAQGYENVSLVDIKNSCKNLELSKSFKPYEQDILDFSQIIEKFMYPVVLILLVTQIGFTLTLRAIYLKTIKTILVFIKSFIFSFFTITLIIFLFNYLLDNSLIFSKVLTSKVIFFELLLSFMLALWNEKEIDSIKKILKKY